MSKNRVKVLMTQMSLDIGGAETHILELAIGLTKMGYDISVASNGGAYVEELTKNGITHYTVPLHTKNPRDVIRSYKMLCSIVESQRFDLIHAHARIPGFISGKICKKYNIPFVTTAHWVFKTSYGLKYITNWGDKTVAVSSDIKKYLLDNYSVRESDINVTINGINTERFSEQVDYSGVLKEFGLKQESFKIVYISRMDSDRAKVAFQLCNIADRLEQTIDDLEIVIVGGGDVFDDLSKLAGEVNQKAGRNLVTLTGARTDINKFVAMSDLFVGVSRSALEAMGGRKPVIVAGNEGYIGLFTKDQLETAILSNFTCRNTEEPQEQKLYEDIIRFYEMPSQQKNEIADYSKQLILERYSVEKMAADTADAYRAALSLNKIPRYGRVDAMISGYYGFNNSGDETLLNALINVLKKEKEDIDLLVLSKNPEETQRQHKVSSINRMSYLKILYWMKHSRLLISGGGSLLQDVTSTKSLLYYLFIIQMGKMLGLKIMIYANGVGPIRKKCNRRIVRKVLNKVDYITLREETSKQELEALGVANPPVEVTADPAFTIEVNHAGKARLSLPEGRKYYVVSIRCWKDFDDKLIGILSKVYSYIWKKYGYIPVFLPMQFPSDLAFSKMTAKEIKFGAVFAEEYMRADEMMDIIQHSEFVIAMRLHTIIYAANVCVPSIGISYDPKVNSFMHSVNNNLVLEIDDISEKNLQSLVDEMIEHNASYRDILESKISEFKLLAEKNAKIAVELMK